MCPVFIFKKRIKNVKSFLTTNISLVYDNMNLYSLPVYIYSLLIYYFLGRSLFAYRWGRSDDFSKNLFLSNYLFVIFLMC